VDFEAPGRLISLETKIELGMNGFARRVIARLDIKGENVVRGIHLEGLRVVGKPDDMAGRYSLEGVDEIIFLDIVATLYGRNNTLALVERTARNTLLPLTVGGGIRTLDDVENVLRSGGDKVAINSAAVRRPDFIAEVARDFGSQCVVAAIEAKRCGPERWTVLIENGREATGLDVVAWARRCSELGAGEILLTSIDRDGTRTGCDLALVREVTAAISVPVIAGGGPGKPAHVAEAFTAGGADAVALGTLLHFNLFSIADVKRELQAAGVPIRPLASCGRPPATAGASSGAQQTA
jgi:imidazole glycerol-phosphate synthase subunit HisF